MMEYRGVDMKTKKVLFLYSETLKTSSGVAEFLALVHGLAYIKKKGLSTKYIYSDCQTAIVWVEKKRVKTDTKPKGKILDLIKRAEYWLKTNLYETKVLKWKTKSWGEIPADFGRK